MSKISSDNFEKPYIGCPIFDSQSAHYQNGNSVEKILVEHGFDPSPDLDIQQFMEQIATTFTQKTEKLELLDRLAFIIAIRKKLVALTDELKDFSLN